MTGSPPRRAPTIAVFDIGNVLIEYDPLRLYRRLLPEPGRAEWFLANICTHEWNALTDRGRPFAESIALLVARHPEWAAEIRAFDTGWHEMIPGPIPANVALLERIRAAGAPAYAITNFSAEKFEAACERFPFLTGFDGAVVSAHERLNKPEPAIYRVLFDRYGIAPGECVFIDDTPANVEAARAAGMHAIHFTPALDLAAALRAIGYRHTE